jgi:hypothetical protein
MKTRAHLFAAVFLCGTPALLQAAVLTPSTAPERTPDGYPVVWLGNAQVDGQPTSTSDAVPASFKRVRTPDQYVRFASGTDKRAYGCYAGGSPQVEPWQMVEVHGREEGEGIKQTFRIPGWRITCQRVPSANGSGSNDLTNVAVPPPSEGATPPPPATP